VPLLLNVRVPVFGSAAMVAGLLDAAPGAVVLGAVGRWADVGVRVGAAVPVPVPAPASTTTVAFTDTMNWGHAWPGSQCARPSALTVAVPGCAAR